MTLTLLIALLLLIAFAIVLLLMYFHFKKQLKRQIKSAQKSEHLKSMFIENISRTLRSPLYAIAGYSDMILEEKDDDMRADQVKELATKISGDTKQLIDFVSQLMEMSKFEGITPIFTRIEVNLIELMASYRRETISLTKPDVTVRVSTDLSPHCRAILDTNMMHQLMMHLLSNAARHITQGDIVMKYGAERKGLKVSVSYTGIGQTELMGADIYSFLQKEDVLKNDNQAPILGLAICRAIVDVLGGEFYVDTEYNKKTVASFWIPCKMKDTYKDM